MAHRCSFPKALLLAKQGRPLARGNFHLSPGQPVGSFPQGGTKSVVQFLFWICLQDGAEANSSQTTALLALLPLPSLYPSLLFPGDLSQQIT